MAEHRSSLDPPGVEAANGLFNGSSSMIPMEIDEEMDSLVHETGDFSGVVSKLTHRKKYHATTRDTAVARASTGFRGLLRSKTAYIVRNVIFMACLAWLVLLFVGKMGEIMGDIESHNMQDEDPRGPHQSSFGGIKNTGQPKGAKAHHKHDIDGDELAAWIQAEDQVGVGVKSASDENVLNHNGHYWHDPYNSPFSSHLYDRTDNELNAEQHEFEVKMNATKEKWGAWNLLDTYYDDNGRARHKPDFHTVKNRDLPIAEFPVDSWQLDEEYVGKFVDQARSMINRVKEGIYAHYYHPTVLPNGTKLMGQDRKDRDALFQVIIEDYVVVNGKASVDNVTGPLPGIAYLSRNAWDGLVRKLLHTLVTNDMFYVVMAGDGAAAGHFGNNFLHTSVMQFHYLMEPVMDFLGIKLISRNMAMGTGDTTFSALGGADIYGEADIMWYFSPRKKESRGQLDLFHKQAILSGERVPILLTPDPVNIELDSNGAAWVGNLQPGAEMCELSTRDTWEDVPPACQLVHCPANTKMWPCAEFNSVCWVNRTTFEPPVKQDDYIRVPRGQKVPGPLKNKLEGHKLSLLLLHALDAAFDKWVDGIEADGFPLIEDHWHVGSLYDKTRETVRSHIPRFNENITQCDGLFKDFPIVCHVEMHAFSEWTPRVNPYESSLSKAMYPTMDYLDFEGEEELYEGIDVLPLQWKVPSDQIDVHAIAISTSIPPLEDKDDGYEFDDDYGPDDTTWIDSDDDLDKGGAPLTKSPTAAPMSAPTPVATPSPTLLPTSKPTGSPIAAPTLTPTPSSGFFVSRSHPDSPAASPTDNNYGGGQRAEMRHGEELLPVQNLVQNEASGRTLNASIITPGKGWMVQNHIPGFCDGSAQSSCNRSPKNRCLLAGHNDFQSGIVGDALSGWLMLRIHHVKEGVILARLDTTVKPGIDTETEGWSSIDQGNDDHSRRHLSIPADFQFDFAINSKVTTLLRSEFLSFGTEIVDGMTLYPLLLNESMSENKRDENGEGQTVDVAIRIRSAEGRSATILLSHLYYA